MGWWADQLTGASAGNVSTNTTGQSFFSDIAPNQYSGPTGAQDYESLWGMSQAGTLGDYMSGEFGLGDKYQKYMTPFEQKPFEFLQQGLGLQQQQLGAEYGQGLQKLNTGQSQAFSKTGFATSGEVQQQGEMMKQNLLDTWKHGTEQAQHGYASDVYGEQQRQVERFYGDIGRVKQFTQ